MPIVNPRHESPTFKLINLLLGGTPSDNKVDEFVTSRRDSGVSWQKIADELSATAGEAVSKAALHLWYPELRPE